VATVFPWHPMPDAITEVRRRVSVESVEGLLREARNEPERAPAVPDWTRERCAPLEWDPPKQLLRALRDYTRARQRDDAFGRLARKLAILRHRFWSAVTGAEIPLNSSRIAGGLLIPHPNGVVVHPEAVIGPNCQLFQQVTLGTGPKPGVPRLGSNVDVGPGAKILGGVTIGDHAVIGANAVVLHDVPAGAVAVGVPAVTKKIGGRRPSGPY